jgi:hypothetical protein
MLMGSLYAIPARTRTDQMTDTIFSAAAKMLDDWSKQ